MKKTITLIICIIMLLFTLTGCITTIAEIRNNPQKYSDRPVLLSGEIDIAVQIPFTETYIYTFKDKTGTIVVFSGIKHKTGDSIILSGSVIAFPEQEMDRDSKKTAAWLKKILIENKLVGKEIARNAADIIIKINSGISGGLGKIFFVKEK